MGLKRLIIMITYRAELLHSAHAINTTHQSDKFDIPPPMSESSCLVIACSFLLASWPSRKLNCRMCVREVKVSRMIEELFGHTLAAKLYLFPFRARSRFLPPRVLRWKNVAKLHVWQVFCNSKFDNTNIKQRNIVSTWHSLSLMPPTNCMCVFLFFSSTWAITHTKPSCNKP